MLAAANSCNAMRRAESGFAASDRPFAIDKKIKHHVSRRRLLREPLDSAGSRMNALQECVKIQACSAADHDFAIQHKLARGKCKQGGNYFRKITAQRLTGLGLREPTSSPWRKARQRNPSHFGSYSQPDSCGNERN